MNKRNHFIMPGEWECHERTIISWPVKDSMVWPENYEELCAGYGNVVKVISAFEPVTLLVNEEDQRYANEICDGVAELRMISHNDGWVRDNGPTFLINEKKERRAICWTFNAWGEKYQPYHLDAKVSRAVAEQLSVECKSSELILEGGSIHSDGEGTILTTEECLLNVNRNPHLTRSDIEDIIKKELNVSTFVWLKRGLYGDETDGHVDNIACFAKPGVVIIQTCDNPEDPNYDISEENLTILKRQKDGRGRSLDIIEIPGPPVRYYNGKRLTLSYLNFYFVNGGIILPIFGGDATVHDQKAVECLQKVFPERKIVTVDGVAIVKEGGNVHCITQQIPAGEEGEKSE